MKKALYQPEWSCEPLYDDTVPGFRGPYSGFGNRKLIYYWLRVTVNVAGERFYVSAHMSPDEEDSPYLPQLLKSLAHQLERTVGKYVLYGELPK